VLASAARADEASGTWTGELNVRAANYYWERSTRVIVPAAGVAVEAPNGLRMNVNYLVDVIASASVGSGVNGDGVFTELRHGVGAGAGKKFALGDNDLDLGVHAIYSTESDYTSWIYGANGSFAWNDKDSTLSLGLTRVADTVMSNANPGFRAGLTGLTTSLGFAQVLSPVLVLNVGYELVVLDGYLGNPYRSPLVGPLPRSETPPRQRLRHNAEGQLSWYLPDSQLTLQLYMRAYVDSWDVRALSPELRAYKQLARDWVGRLRYRYYVQSAADFAAPGTVGQYAAGYTGPLTKDPKLSAFDSHQLGARLEFTLTGLTGTILDFGKRAVLDLSFDYQWCTSAFGNNVIATAGGRLPF
jgi:Protein of unknown function (DUF3570)